MHAKSDSLDKMEQLFQQTPKDQPLAVYWYWLDGTFPRKERFTYLSTADIQADSDMRSSGLPGPVQNIAYSYKIIR